MTWTSKSPSYQGLRTPLRVIAGRCKMTVLRNYCLELLSWNYLSLLLNRSTDRATDRPTFARMGAMGGGGGGLETYLRGNLFMLGD